MLDIQIENIDTNKLDNEIRNTIKGHRKEIYKQEVLLRQYGLKFQKLQYVTIPQYPQDSEIKQHYSIDELLIYSNKNFIENSYRCLLHREVDSSGINNYLEKLNNGKLNKIDIIGRLYFSKECRKSGAKISGIFMKLFLSTTDKIPFIGYIIRLIFSLIFLPVLQKQQEKTIDALSIQLDKVKEASQHDAILNQNAINEIIRLINSNNKALLNVLGKLILEEISHLQKFEKDKKSESC